MKFFFFGAIVKGRRIIPFLILYWLPLLAEVNSSPQFPLPKNQALELARKDAADFFKGDSRALWEQMTSVMQQKLKSQADWDNFNKAALQQIGQETGVVSERILPILRSQNYTRVFTISAASVKMMLTINLDPEGKVAGFFLTRVPNPAESNYLDYKTKTSLRLPFRGEWTVFQGGRSVADNYHAEFSDERFAYDILIVRNDRDFSSDPQKLEDHYAFGEPVLAPADGKVFSAVDKYDDNPPMKPSSESPKEGNNIVIDHGNGEFSMLAHLKRGSVKVKPGDLVKSGQEIAACGNSGNSPIPHLHYHLQTTPEWFKGEGFPIQFTHFVSNGKPVDRGEPVRGDVISNP